jgi:hypothetical protein
MRDPIRSPRLKYKEELILATRDSSLQEQSPLAQAQNSADKAHHAVTQAQSHPNTELIQQAEHAIAKAERSIEQADAMDNKEALDMARSSLEQDKASLQQLRS